MKLTKNGEVFVTDNEHLAAGFLSNGWTVETEKPKRKKKTETDE